MFYDNFVRLCNRVNKSPSSVATEIGLSRASVNGWKNGKKPTDATTIKLADYFGVSVDELIGNAENEKSPQLFDNSEQLGAYFIITVYYFLPAWRSGRHQ